MTIRQAIDEQFTKIDLTKLSHRASDDLHLAKSLATYGWATRQRELLMKARTK